MRETPQEVSSERRASDFRDACSGYSRYALNDLTLPYWWARQRIRFTMAYDGSSAGSAQFSVIELDQYGSIPV